MPIVLGNTSITGLAVGGLPNGSVNSTSLANSSVTTAKLTSQRAIIAVHTSVNTTRSVTGAGSGQTFMSWTLTKVSSTSTLHFEVCIPGHGNTNSGAYFGIGIDGSVDYSGTYHADEAQENGTYMRQIRTGISAGARTIDFRMNSLTGVDGRGIDVINPNNSDDVRNRQQGTVWTVFEIEA